MRKALLAGLSVLVILLCSLFALTACGDKVSEISIDRNNMPQVVFVLGNDLDLSKGKLNYGDSSVALNDEGVEVSGYDKTKEGAQTLTISYKGLTTQLQVTVVPRFQPAEKYVYFIGETFADAQPRINITRDDGTRITVNYNDSALKINNFDSSAAKDNLTLNAVYEKGDEKYEGTFDITVSTPTYVFRAPNKTEYGSHVSKSDFDITGLSLSVKNADGSVTRNIRTSDLTFEGFDPSVATAQTPTAVNTITVKYRGNVAAVFNVTIKYSDVSRFIDAAAEYSNLDWNCYEMPDAEHPEMALPEGVSNATAQQAIDLIQLYYSFTKEQASYIKKSELETVARIAIVYGYNLWMNAVKNDVYADAFYVSPSGILEYVCDTPDKATAAANKLNNDKDTQTSVLFTLGDLFTKEIFSEDAYFADTLVYNSKLDNGDPVTLTIGQMSIIFSDSAYLRKVAQVLEWSVDAYNDLKDIASPANYSGYLSEDFYATLKSNVTRLDEAYTSLFEILENEAMSSEIYQMLNNWRDSDDFFEILYRYYTVDCLDENSATSESSLTKISNLASMLLPKPIEDLIPVVEKAYIEQTMLQTIAGLTQEKDFDPTDSEIAVLLESTSFIIAYDNAKKATEEFFAQYNVQDATLDTYDITYAFLYQAFLSEVWGEVYSGDYGYSQLLGSSVNDDAVLNLWATYSALWKEYSDDATVIENAAFQTRIKDMFNAFANLLPIEQYNFMKSLNFLYDQNLPPMVLAPSYNYLASDFANFIYTIYAEALNIDLESVEDETAYTVFSNLLQAIEGYANGDVNFFGACMEAAEEAYNGEWVGGVTDSSAFDELLGPVYDRYLDYYSMFVKNEDDEYVYDDSALGENMGGYADQFKNIEIATANASLSNYYIEASSSTETMGMQYFMLFLSSYEQAMANAEIILNSGNEDVIRAYYNMPFGSGIAAESLFNSVYDLQADYTRYLSIMGVSQEEYESMTQLRAFLADYASYFWTVMQIQMNATAEEGSMVMFAFAGPVFEFTPAAVTEITTDFLALPASQQFIFLYMDSILSLYHNGFSLGMEDVFELDSQKTLLQTLTELQITYIGYSYATEQTEPDQAAIDEYKADMIELWNTAEDIYDNQFIQADRDEFDSYFGYMYNFLKDACTALEA